MELLPPTRTTPAPPFAPGEEFPVNLGDDALDALRLLFEDAAGLGDKDLLADLIKERYAEEAGQLPDLSRHRRLADQQFLGGPGETAAAGHGEEDTELVKREPAKVCPII